MSLRMDRRGQIGEAAQRSSGDGYPGERSSGSSACFLASQVSAWSDQHQLLRFPCTPSLPCPPLRRSTMEALAVPHNPPSTPHFRLLSIFYMPGACTPGILLGELQSCCSSQLKHSMLCASPRTLAHMGVT